VHSVPSPDNIVLRDHVRTFVETFVELLIQLERYSNCITMSRVPFRARRCKLVAAENILVNLAQAFIASVHFAHCLGS
jgi:hypothetical protein